MALLLASKMENTKKSQETPCQTHGDTQPSLRGECWPALFWFEPAQIPCSHINLLKYYNTIPWIQKFKQKSIYLI